MNIEEELRAYIVDEVRNGLVPEALTDQTPLIERGFVDSLGLLQLVTFLEQNFGVEVRDDELVLGNFRTVHTIADLVRRKLDPAS